MPTTVFSTATATALDHDAPSADARFARIIAHPAGARRVAYWTCTGITAAVFLSGGLAYLAGAEAPLAGMAALGYPAYFVTVLGAWKVLAAAALLSPRLPRLKEWGYAGIAFDLTGAAISHLAMGHGVAKALVPLGFLAVALASWALRPSSRRLDETRVM
ncbi:MAG: DoxX family protein [Gemmatimonadaceae bacterium]|nr:DoxX family protein [Gemmatimonadaceae bacterium]